MKVAILGAGGFVGRNLVRFLLENTTHEVVAIYKSPKNIQAFDTFGSRYRAELSDVFDTVRLEKTLSGVDAVYYLVHMMNGKTKDLYLEEAKVAYSFAEAVLGAGVKRVIYLSGLGKDTDHLSEHLRSRHNTGDIFRSKLSGVIELRASVVVGRGSVSFEIVRRLVRNLPVMVLPGWGENLTQPICLSDVLKYLVSALTVSIDKNEIVEIGGPRAMKYREFMLSYAKYLNKKRFIVALSFLPNILASWWLDVFTPGYTAKVGAYMVSSLKNEVVVTSDRARELFPEVVPVSIEDGFY